MLPGKKKMILGNAFFSLLSSPVATAKL